MTAVAISFAFGPGAYYLYRQFRKDFAAWDQRRRASDVLRTSGALEHIQTPDERIGELEEQMAGQWAVEQLRD